MNELTRSEENYLFVDSLDDVKLCISLCSMESVTGKYLLFERLITLYIYFCSASVVFVLAIS